jgi:transcription termination factor Rho
MEMHLSEIKRLPPTEIVKLASELNLQNISRMRKQDQIFAILKEQAKRGTKIAGGGVVEILQDGFGFLRSADMSYLAGPDDIYVSPASISAPETL